MARKVFEVSLALAFVMMLFARSSAQTPGGCTPVLSSLSPCISYIVGNSSAPTSTCCSQLAGLMQTQTQCLCAILGGGISQLGFIINQTQALTLPGACKLRMSPDSRCSGFTVSTPTAAPAEAPTPASPPETVTAPAPAPTTATSPTTANTVPGESTPSVPSASAPSGNGSKTTTETSTARSSTKFTPALFFFFLLFVTSCA
ncbi:non-specific lipid-transfer protein-like protein [Canna indica]|uniref:Non-specific lipid-transfer protein-like protein n=1 Tax=Canna indica TaxID=4628 RepID=A0AAQ3PX72_9LILI|nr:non-specific lipid-transfer protein-like protein [Canna indica]